MTAEESRAKAGKRWRQQNQDYMREYGKRYYTENSDRIKEQWKEYRDRTRNTNPQSIMIRMSRCRAKKIGVEFTLTATDIIIPHECPILNIPLFFTKGKVTHNTPSIDRINNNKGYTPDNIQIVSTRANKLKNDATIEELELLIEHMRRITK